jgi:DNA-binding LytR/AlgR family response regulator
MLAKRGYEVRPLTNGLQALEAARLMPPDLILLDIMMPEIDGYEVCERKFSMVLIGSGTFNLTAGNNEHNIEVDGEEAGFYFRIARGVKPWLLLIFTIMCTRRNILKRFKLAPVLIR